MYFYSKGVPKQTCWAACYSNVFATNCSCQVQHLPPQPAMSLGSDRDFMRSKRYQGSFLPNKVGFRNFSGFRNSDSETLSLDSETLSLDSETFASDSKTFSPDSETLSSETFSLDSETLFVGFRNFFRRIQKLFSSDSESLFVGFRNCFRRIQKLFSSDSETLVVGFRNSFRPMLSMITTFLLSKISPPSPWQPNPCFQWLLHSFHQNLTPPLGNPCFQWFRFKYYIPFIKIFTFLLSRFPSPSGNPTHAVNDYYIPFIKIWPNPLATHAFNDSGSSTTFLLSRFLHFFYQHFPFPLGNPTHAVNDYYIPFIKISPLPLATQPTLSMITTFLLSKFDPPPPLGNPCFQWFRFKYYIPLSRFLHLFYQHFPSPPLATQPMLSMITTFLLSKFPLPWQPNPCFQWLLHFFYQNLTPPPLATHAFNDSGSSITFLLSRFLHSFYQDFPLPPLATQPMLSMITTFILSKFPPPLGNPTHALNDSCSSTTFLSSRFLHSFYQDFPPPPLATQPMLSMITTFLLSKFLPPLGNQTHAFNDYYIPFIKIPPPPLGNPCFQWFMCKYYIPLIKIFTFLWSKFDPPPPWQPMLSMILVQVLHSFYQDFYIPFINISSPPLATQPMLLMITTFLLSKFRSPPWQPNPCFQWLLHSFYQNSPPPLG